MRTLSFIVSLLLFAANGAIVFWSVTDSKPAGAPFGKAFPHFSLPRLTESASPLTQEDLAAHDLIAVNVFASWCGPCRVEHPLLTELAERIPIVGINYMDMPDAAREFLRELGDPYADIALDREGIIGRTLKVDTVPRTYLVANGRIVYRHHGRLKRRDVDQDVLPLIRVHGGQSLAHSRE